MSSPGWTLTTTQRRVLEAALDALLPPEGSYPAPSSTDLIDDFILARVPAASTDWVPFPWLDADGLRAILEQLAQDDDILAGLETLEASNPGAFVALWRLAVYGYYSRPETIAAIQREHNVVYHGAPLPLGYPEVLPLWDAADPLQLAVTPVGNYIATDAVRRWDVRALREELETDERAITD